MILSTSRHVTRLAALVIDGGYNDEANEKIGPGKWRVKSSVHVAPGTAH